MNEPVDPTAAPDGGPVIRQWLAGALPRGAGEVLARMARSEDVVQIAVMPDVHVADDVCVGTVVATRRLIYPAAVGGDIGCGMAAIAFDAMASQVLRDDAAAARVLNGLYRVVPANRHAGPRPLPDDLAAEKLTDPRLESVRRRDGAVQFGTLGRGNHFLEFQADEEGRLWLMVHSGSRAVGPAVRDLHLAGATRSATGLAYLDADTPAGQAYVADAAWAVRYAAASRRAMVDAAAELLAALFSVRAMPDTFVNGDHNHVRREVHGRAAFWVHRKGAAPAAAGEAGVIPGSMGSRSYHVEGRGCAEALCSSSHGAGRAMSRDEARRRVSVRGVMRQMHGIWFDHRMVDRLRDEAPAAYKDIGSVMRAQRELTRIVRTLRPVLCYKGS